MYISLRFIPLYFILACFLCLANKASSQINTDSLQIDTCVSLQLGDKKINIINYSHTKTNLKYLVIHDNEDTGLKAALKFIRSNGGSVTDLQYGGVRNIVFSDNINVFQFDPNTMFTDAGSYKGIKKYSYQLLNPKVTRRVRNLGQQVLACYNPDSLGYIITLHNNTDGAFSIQSYKEGSYLFNTAAKLYINESMDPDDMVFVTEPWFFNYLKDRNINVVLQSNDAEDDGSLSVYAMNENIPYINIEIQHGHLEEHFRLIEIADQMIKEFFAKRSRGIADGK